MKQTGLEWSIHLNNEYTLSAKNIDLIQEDKLEKDKKRNKKQKQTG